MTEELEKEAEEWLCNNLHSASEEDFIKAMVDIAEPREKQIEIDAKQIRALQKQNGELTDKVKQLERKTASIRGSHRVDLAKLNARIEQVERLKKENAELKDELKKWKDGIALKDEEIGCIETDFNTFKSEAKEIIKELLNSCFGYNSKTVNYEVKAKAEQFLKEE